MMPTVPHVTSCLGLRKFQADGFLLTRVYDAPVLAHLLKCACQGSASVDFSNAAQGNAISGIRTHSPFV